VPSLNGLSISGATRKLERMGFTVEKRYIYDDRVPKYKFMSWSPGPGSWISEFGTIYAVYSNGRDPKVVAEEKAAAKKKAQEKKRKQQQQQPPPTLPPTVPPGPR
jgi:beta-lactam-binding protein with PASTA domain